MDAALRRGSPQACLRATTICSCRRSPHCLYATHCQRSTRNNPDLRERLCDSTRAERWAMTNANGEPLRPPLPARLHSQLAVDDDAAPEHLAALQRLHALVDLVQRVPLRHELVQRQPALAKPGHILREIAIGNARTAQRATEDLLAEQQLARIDRRRRHRYAHEHRRAAGRDTPAVRAHGLDDLRHRLRHTDSVEGVIDAATAP